jgi:hypothetical protein
MSQKRTQIAEVDIARPVVEYLEGAGWTVYQEVETISGIADIIAILDKRLWIVEVKNSLSLSLMAQAGRWLCRAHWVSVAFPMMQKVGSMTEGRRFAMQILEERGIGTIVVDFSRTPVAVSEYRGTPARMIRRPLPGAIRFIRDNLKEQQRTFANAGSRGGAHWTPYKESCEYIRRYVKANPGVSVKQVVDELGKLHYATGSSARHSISAMAREGHIPDVVARKQDGKLRLFIEGNS